MKKLFLMMVIVFITTIPSMSASEMQDSIVKDTLAMNESTHEIEKEELESTFAAVMDNMSVNLVPVVGIIFTFGTPVLIIFVVFLFEHKKRKAKYELAAKIIESGKEIPDGLFTDMKAEKKSVLAKGIITTFTGLGLTILLFALVNAKIASVGLMIICIGVGQIIIHIVMKPSSRRKREERNASQNDRPQEDESI